MKRPEPPKAGAKSVAGAKKGSWEAAHPGIMEHLTHETYEDGSARVPSTISLFFEDGLPKLALNDKDNRRSLYVTAESVTDAYDALEAILARGGGDWRAWKGLAKKK